jgi:hypothetical protein
LTIVHSTNKGDHHVVLVRELGEDWDGYRLRIGWRTRYTPRAPRRHSFFRPWHVVLRLEKTLKHPYGQHSHYWCMTCNKRWVYAPPKER